MELFTHILLQVVWHKHHSWSKKNPIHIGHIRAHSDLPAGNDCIDKALIGEALVSDPIVLAKCDHYKIHFSSHNSMLQHKIGWE